MKDIIKRFVIFFLIGIGGLIFVLSNQLGEFRLFIVSSGSMEPTIPTGSLVLTRYIHPQKLQTGDVITFLPPTEKKEFVTHRITTLTHQETLSVFKTKGDRNEQADTWTLAGGSIVGKVIFSVAYLGYVFAFLQSKIGLILFVLLPTIYIVLGEIQNIIRLFKGQKKQSPQDSQVTNVCLLLFGSFLLFAIQPSSAQLSDSATLTTNSINSTDEDEDDDKHEKKEKKQKKPKHHNHPNPNL